MLALSIQQGLIEDDTKAAARQSPNCIKKRNNKIRRKQFSIYVWNSFTLQCDTWVRYYEMPLNSPKRPPYWNSTSGFDFDHVTTVDMSFCTSLRNFIQIGLPIGRK